MRWPTLTWIVSLLAAGAVRGAEPIPVGGEFQVNTYTTSYQYSSAVSPDGSGGFVVVWESHGSSGTDTSYTSILGQRYGPDGLPLGGEFQVNTYTTHVQTHPTVSLDGTGGFVVVWESNGSSGTDTSSRSVQGQRYDQNGLPLGGEFQVNDYTTGFQSSPAASPDGSGGFVVVWRSVGSNGTDPDVSVQGQRYGPDGLPLGGQFQVNTYTTSDQTLPAVTGNGAGGFVVVWQSGGSGGTDTDGASVQGQRYGSDGSPLGGEFQVNTYTTSSQVLPAVSSDGAGGFVVTWTSFGSSGTDTDISSVQGQRYGPDGSPLGGEFQVNTYTTSLQEVASVGLDGSGGLVVTWNSSSNIQGQRYALPLFADGFESGDTTAWSNTVP